MNSQMVIGVYRSILRQSKTYPNYLDISKGVMTFRDSKYFKNMYVDTYISESYDIETTILGPYKNTQLNVISWIKNEIRERRSTKNNIDTLFEVHRDLGEILTIAGYGPMVRDEY